MEELQLLKYMVNKNEFNFTQDWHCTEEEVESENTFQDLVEGWVEEKEPDDSDNESFDGIEESFDLENISNSTEGSSLFE